MANKQPEPAAPVAKLDHPNTPLERLVEENLKSILIAGGIIFAVIIGYLVFDYVRRSKTEDEAIAFTRASTIEEYRQVITDRPGSLAAGNAQLMIAKLRKKEEDGAEEAKSELRTFLETNKDHPQRDQALFTLAGIYVEEGKPEEAVPHLDALIQEHPDSPLAGYAKLYKGDFAYAADNKDEAELLYNLVLTDYTGTPAEMAAQRLDLVKIDKPVSIPPRPVLEVPLEGADLPRFILRPEEPVPVMEGAPAAEGDDAAAPAEGDDEE
jgi:predicted negative regulator of RcsB-dependent stress response